MNDFIKNKFAKSQNMKLIRIPYTVRTIDQGNIPSRQSLSELLKPRADNGNDGGFKDPIPRPGTQPGQANNE